VDTYANLPDDVTGRQRFSAGERAYRLEAMQYMVADMEARYARLPNQPNLREILAFHQRLVLPPSQRGRSEVIWEFTVVYPNPDLEVDATGTRGASGNEDLGPWQSHMAWEYGTDWVAGFLAHQRRYVTGPPPANVGLWPIAPLTHHKSEESEEEGDNKGQGAVEGTQEVKGPQGVTAPSGLVMAPPSIALPVIAPTVPRTGRTGVSAPPVIPTPTVAPTPMATPTVPVTPAPERPVGTTGAQLPRERPPTTEERHPKRVATEAAATLQGPQLTAGGGQQAQPLVQCRREGRRLTSGGRKPRQRSSGFGHWANNSRRKPKQNPPTQASERPPEWRRTRLKRPRRRRGKPGKSVWRPWAPSQ
jgi:hypothetical protein